MTAVPNQATTGASEQSGPGARAGSTTARRSATVGTLVALASLVVASALSLQATGDVAAVSASVTLESAPGAAWWSGASISIVHEDTARLAAVSAAADARAAATALAVAQAAAKAAATYAAASSAAAAKAAAAKAAMVKAAAVKAAAAKATVDKALAAKAAALRAATAQDAAKAAANEAASQAAAAAARQATAAQVAAVQAVAVKAAADRAAAAGRAARSKTRPTSGAQPVQGSAWVEQVRRCIVMRESSGQYGVVDSSGTWFGAYQFAIGTSNVAARMMGRYDLVGVTANRWTRADQDRAFYLIFAGGAGRGNWAGGRYACW